MLPNASAEDIGSRAAAALDKHLNDNPELKAEYVKNGKIMARKRSEVEKAIWAFCELHCDPSERSGKARVEKLLDDIEIIYTH